MMLQFACVFPICHVNHYAIFTYHHKLPMTSRCRQIIICQTFMWMKNPLVNPVGQGRWSCWPWCGWEQLFSAFLCKIQNFLPNCFPKRFENQRRQNESCSTSTARTFIPCCKTGAATQKSRRKFAYIC